MAGGFADCSTPWRLMLLCDERRAPPPMTPEDDLCWGSQDDLRPPLVRRLALLLRRGRRLERADFNGKPPADRRSWLRLAGRNGRFAPLSLAGPQGGRADIDGTLAEKQASWRP